MIRSGKKEETHAFHDQIANQAGPDGFESGPGRPAGLLQSIFKQNLHSTAAVCHSGAAPVSENRLSRNNSNAARFLRSAPRLETEAGAALFHPLLRPAKALKKRAFDRLLDSIFKRARACGLINEKPEGAIDATGLESRHCSRYYVHRKGQRPFLRYRWVKLTAVCHTHTHLIAGALISRGPSNDSPQFGETMKMAARNVHFDRLLADAGYDGEHNHRLCREELGIRSTVIPLNKRHSGNKMPKTKYRRQMKRRFHNRIYGNRWQAESVFSRNKRLLGAALRARHEQAQYCECYLRVLTHNLMILRRAIYRVSTEQDRLLV